MDRQVLDGIAEARRRLYAAAQARPEELARCAARRFGGPPPPDQWLDFLDFFAIEWVDGEGYCLADRVELPPEAQAWPREVRTALWVVDGWDDGRVLLRDSATEAEVAVEAAGLEEELPRRSVLRARVLPWGDRCIFAGEPDLYGVMGVIARMELAEAWRQSGEPALLAELAELRAAFTRQREERAAFVGFFGADILVCADAAELEARLAAFAHHLFEVYRPPSLGGRTRMEAWRARKGESPRVGFTVGESLRQGRPGLIYDEVEGVHFYPSLGEFFGHLRGELDAPELVRAWLAEPGISRLPFRRAGGLDRLRALAGPGELEEILDRHKPRIERHSPNHLPGVED